MTYLLERKVSMAWTANSSSRGLSKGVVRYLILRQGDYEKRVKPHSNMNRGAHTG
jgi:hypothetical protein